MAYGVPMAKDAELESFKTEINLTEFAASRGYVLDRRGSWDSCALMRHPNGDKIGITINKETGHWVYYNWHDKADSGSIIDFVKLREGKNSLGRARQVLRPWVGGSPRPVSVPPALYVQKLLPVSRDPEAVAAAWKAARVCFGLPYLTGRGLPPDVFILPRFEGCLRVSGDRHKNALFPHYDRAGLCGFEMKNEGFTGFAKGGIKGLWYSKAYKTDRQLLFIETAIDGLSWHVLHPDQLWTRYMSTGGKLGPQQPALIRSAMERLPEGGVILLGFDNDPDGEKLAEEFAALAPSGRDVRRVKPDQGFKDWNEMLKKRLGLG